MKFILIGVAVLTLYFLLRKRDNYQECLKHALKTIDPLFLAPREEAGHRKWERMLYEKKRADGSDRAFEMMIVEYHRTNGRELLSIRRRDERSVKTLYTLRNPDNSLDERNLSRFNGRIFAEAEWEFLLDVLEKARSFVPQI